MTIPTERTRAVLATRQFLFALTNPGQTPNVPENIREQALSLLRHYPDDGDMNLVGLACPNWFAISDEFSML
jgi:hypothetical protein